MNYKKAFLLRLTIMLTVFTGLIIRCYTTYTEGIERGNILYSYYDMLSYFTIQSNFMVAVYYTLSAVYTYKKKQNFMFNPLVKGAVTLYITLTGIIFIVLLSPIYHPEGIAAVSNYIFHYITPVLVLADWFFFENKRTYKWRYSVLWLIYPLIYCVFILIRGLFINMYPYPFINVTQLGYNKVLVNSLFLTLFFTLLGVLFVLLNKRKFL